MIRRCNSADKDIWCSLNKEFMSYEYQDENVWENPLSKGEPEEIFELILDNPDSHNLLYLIEEEGEIIGFMNTAYFMSIWAHGNILFLDDFFITEDKRGKGYGKKALSELENQLKYEGYKRIQLMAEDTNPKAVSFYEREGYSRQRINFFCKYL